MPRVALKNSTGTLLGACMLGVVLSCLSCCLRCSDVMFVVLSSLLSCLVCSVTLYVVMSSTPCCLRCSAVLYALLPCVLCCHVCSVTLYVVFAFHAFLPSFLRTAALLPRPLYAGMPLRVEAILCPHPAH